MKTQIFRLILQLLVILFKVLCTVNWCDVDWNKNSIKFNNIGAKRLSAKSPRLMYIVNYMYNKTVGIYEFWRLWKCGVKKVFVKLNLSKPNLNSVLSRYNRLQAIETICKWNSCKTKCVHFLKLAVTQSRLNEFWQTTNTWHWYTK